VTFLARILISGVSTARWRWGTAFAASLWGFALGAGIGGAASGSALREPSSAAQQLVVAAAIRAVEPALVKIDVVDVEYEEGREKKSESSGSGVIITPEGHVITNHHVAGNAKRLVCTLANKEELEAELVGTDPLSDIAVIKLKPRAPTTFPVAKFGDSSLVRQGDRVLAMGSPYAFSQSVTMGIVANSKLVMPKDIWYYRIKLEGEDIGSVVTWIAHDAAIYGGNSGGPLVNLKGEIVGINEMRMGLSGAIPSNLARGVAAQLIEKGEVTRSWIGLEVQPQRRVPPRGVLVGGAIPGSPADRAGFRPGDVLVRFAGQDVSVQFREELAAFNQLVLGLPVGTQVEAVVLRGGALVTLQVRTEKREKVEPRQQELKEWGICARDLSLMAVKEMGLDRRDGVLVTSVRPGGPGGEARPPIAEKDVIVGVGETPIKALEDLIAVTGRVTAASKGPTPVLVSFIRGRERYLTVVKVGIRELEDPGREVRKAWLPIASQVLTRDLAQALGLADHTGVRVTQVYPGSSAEKAGLKVGDVIIALNGQPIPAAEPQDVEVLPAMVRQLRIGTSVELTVLRDKQQLSLAVELVPSPPLAREMKRYRDVNFEFTARDLTFFDRVEQRWPQEQSGALVQEVNEGGWAALGNLAPGDLITTVDGAPVANVETLEARMQEVAKRRADRVMLQVRRGIHHLFVEMRPAWPGST
jgi:serine protease Do